jgi:hypothetical protein
VGEHWVGHHFVRYHINANKRKAQNREPLWPWRKHEQSGKLRS